MFVFPTIMFLLVIVRMMFLAVIVTVLFMLAVIVVMVAVVLVSPMLMLNTANYKQSFNGNEDCNCCDED